MNPALKPEENPARCSRQSARARNQLVILILFLMGGMLALLTVLEGLSLWQGQPLRVALYVADNYPAGLESTLLGNELWPTESQLVQFDIVHPVRPKRLDGVGDFRLVRQIARGWGQ